MMVLLFSAIGVIAVLAVVVIRNAEIDDKRRKLAPKKHYDDY